MAQFVILLTFKVIRPTNLLHIRIAEIVDSSQSFVDDTHLLLCFHRRIMVRRTMTATLLTSVSFPIDYGVFDEGFQYRQKRIPIAAQRAHGRFKIPSVHSVRTRRAQGIDHILS